MEKQKKAVKYVIWFLATVSAYTSCLGFAVSNAWYEAIMLGAAGAMVQVWTWGYLAEYFPEANKKQKWQLAVGAAIVCIFVFFMSTEFSVVMAGGKVATMAYFEDAIAKTREASRNINIKSAQEDNMGNQIEGLAGQFDAQAKMEREGDRSGSGQAGEGTVFFNLQTVAGSLHMVAKNITDNHEKKTKFNSQLETALDSAQQISLSVVGEASRSQAFHNSILAFTRQAAAINQALSGLENTSSATFLAAVNENLKLLEARPSDTPNQKAAIARCATLVDQARKIIEQISKRKEDPFGAHREDLVPIVSMEQAVIRYWKDCLPEWCMGISLDFFYPVMIYFLSIGWKQDKEREEQEQERAENEAELQQQAAARQREALAQAEARQREEERQARRGNLRGL